MLVNFSVAFCFRCCFGRKERGGGGCYVVDWLNRRLAQRHSYLTTSSTCTESPRRYLSPVTLTLRISFGLPELLVSCSNFSLSFCNISSQQSLCARPVQYLRTASRLSEGDQKFWNNHTIKSLSIYIINHHNYIRAKQFFFFFFFFLVSNKLRKKYIHLKLTSSV